MQVLESRLQCLRDELSARTSAFIANSAPDADGQQDPASSDLACTFVSPPPPAVPPLNLSRPCVAASPHLLPRRACCLQEGPAAGLRYEDALVELSKEVREGRREWAGRRKRPYDTHRDAERGREAGTSLLSEGSPAVWRAADVAHRWS